MSKANLTHVLTVEEQRRGGRVSAQKRKERQELRELLQTALTVEEYDFDADKKQSKALSIITNLINIATDTSQPFAAIRAIEIILRMLGQDRPTPGDTTEESLRKLDEILELNRQLAYDQERGEAAACTDEE